MSTESQERSGLPLRYGLDLYTVHEAAAPSCDVRALCCRLAQEVEAKLTEIENWRENRPRT
jgi:hypothetical protein